jgi:hypothetical protein
MIASFTEIPKQLLAESAGPKPPLLVASNGRVRVVGEAAVETLVRVNVVSDEKIFGIVYL